MTTIGNDFPVRAAAFRFRFRSEKRASSAEMSPARTECFDIPCSPDNPEFLRVDDAEIVGDLIAPLAPVRRHVLA